MEEKISFTLAMRKVNYLGINFIRNGQDLYEEVLGIGVGSLKIASVSLVRCTHLRSGRWELGNHPAVALGLATGEVGCGFFAANSCLYSQASWVSRSSSDCGSFLI